MNQDQIDSLARSLVKIAGGILTAHGLTATATVVTSNNVIELITGVVMAFIGFYASHTSNAAQPVNTNGAEVTPKVTTTTTATSTPLAVQAAVTPSV